MCGPFLLPGKPSAVHPPGLAVRPGNIYPPSVGELPAVPGAYGPLVMGIGCAVIGWAHVVELALPLCLGPVSATRVVRAPTAAMTTPWAASRRADMPFRRCKSPHRGRPVGSASPPSSSLLSQTSRAGLRAGLSPCAAGGRVPGRRPSPTALGDAARRA